jgi:preprotein translocase subunit SecB
MSDTIQNGAAEPVFSIEKIYVRDLSIEVPNAPQVFLEREAPGVSVQIQTAATNLSEGAFDVVLTVTVTAKKEDKTFFLVEVAQAGIFRLQNIPEEEMQPILAIGCPNILFPYARESISDAVNRAGFPPVLLSPVNFEALYQQNQQTAGAANTPLQ